MASPELLQQFPDTRAGPELASPEGKRGLRLSNIVLGKGGLPRNISFTGHVPGNSDRFGTLSECESKCKEHENEGQEARPRTAGFLAIAMIAGLAFLAACNPPASDQHLQEQAAQATETAKQQSKEALAQARVAAANAERAVNDVAAGVKAGLR